MNTPTFIFPSILSNERDDGAVSAYLDATREESGCSLMEAIRTLVNNLNVYRVRARQKLALRLYRDPMTHRAVMRAVFENQEDSVADFVTVTFIGGVSAPFGFVDVPEGEDAQRYIVGVEWLLAHRLVAPLVARLEPDSVPPIS